MSTASDSSLACSRTIARRKREAWACLGVVLGVLVLVYDIRSLQAAGSWQSAWSWWAGAGVVWGLALVEVSRYCRALAPDSRLVFDSWFGLANALTLSRVIATAVLVAEGVSPDAQASIPLAMLYLWVAVADGLDGWWARRSGSVTALGAHLDLRADALGLAGAPCIAWHLGRLPAWYLLLAFAYPLYRLAIGVRRVLGKPIYEERVLPSLRTRFFAGMQMGLVTAALAPFASTANLKVVSTVWMSGSLIAFVRDWGTVAGWWVPGFPAYERRRAQILDFMRGPIAVTMRALAGGCGAMWLLQGNDPMLASAVGVMLVAMCCGVLPRISALLLLVLLVMQPLTWLLGSWLVALTWVLLWGDAHACFAPDDRWLHMQLGVAKQSVSRSPAL